MWKRKIGAFGAEKSIHFYFNSENTAADRTYIWLVLMTYQPEESVFLLIRLKLYNTLNESVQTVRENTANNIIRNLTHLVFMGIFKYICQINLNDGIILSPNCKFRMDEYKVQPMTQTPGTLIDGSQGLFADIFFRFFLFLNYQRFIFL